MKEMRILLIDDSNTMRRMQKNQLMQMGIDEIFEADNGQNGLDMLKKMMPIDLILLDWNMPVMNGITFLKTIRANSEYNGIKVIMCTSESEKGKVIEAMREGANNYIVKPFTPANLQEKLGIFV